MSQPHVVVQTCDALRQQPAEFQEACRKLVVSHAINELHGARVFDEPAVALAPTPYAKWLTCRVAMEEYGHHVRFFELGREMGVPAERMMPGASDKPPLSIFDFELKTWEEFCVIKMLGDLGEILQVEDLVQASFIPLRNLARMTMPEERFHAAFGEDFCTELIETPEARARVQDAIDRIFPTLPAFFGRPKSRNNEMYRKWGLKVRTNEDMRVDFVERARRVVEDKLGLSLPKVDALAA
jgi:ring-1,2-phenylacetyl-CoA epoxidase subunit PaaA